MKSLIPICFAGIIFTLLVTSVPAGTISGVASQQPLIKPQVLPQAESPDSKTKQVETTKQQAGTVVVKPATQTVPVLPGIKTIAPLSPSESLQKPAPRESPAVRSPVPGKSSPVKTPQLRTSPLMKSPVIRASPLLTRPGVGVVGRKGATAVSGIVVEKMRGAQQADLLLRGKGLNRITSALIFLDNRPVADVTLKRGLATANTLKVSLVSAKGKLKNNTTARSGNYELRLRAGMDEFKLLTPIGPAVGSVNIDIARHGKVAGSIALEPTDSSGGSTPSTGTQTDGSDLVVLAIRQDPAIEGSFVRLEIDIQNQGNWTASSPNSSNLIGVSTEQNNWSFSTGAGGHNLLPGQTHTVIKYQDVPVGTHPVLVRVDPDNAVSEINESNNELAGSVTVSPAQGPSDLVITEIHTNPANPSVVTGFSLVITVENQGGARASIYSGDIISSVGTNNILYNGNFFLDPGQTRQLTIGATNITPGPFNWTVMVDPQNQVAESDENNNTMSISGTIQTDESGGSTPPAGTQADGPDLVVLAIRQDPAIEGTFVRLEIDIQNQGNWTASSPNSSNLIGVSTEQNNWSFSTGAGGHNLLPGQTHTVTKYQDVPVGTHPVLVRVDPDNLVTETNENNNELAGSVIVSPAQGPPDLVITNIQPSQANPSMVTGFHVMITVENRGGARASIYSGDVISTVGSNNILYNGNFFLDPGQTRQLNLGAFNISPGPFNWTVMIDPQNIVLESDESNNSMSISGTIGQ